MRKNFYIITLGFILTSCFVSNENSLKSVQDYSTENVNIKSNKVVDAEIIFVNGEKVKTKLQALKSVDGSLDEASITQYFAIYDKNGKRNFLTNKVVKEMRILDYANEERIFVNRSNYPNALQELVYDGRIKWYVEYTFKGLGDKKIVNYFVDEEARREVRWDQYDFRKKFKEFTNSNIEVLEDIEKVDKNNKLEIIKILRSLILNQNNKNMKLLEGKVALITGAATGIGKRIAEVFAEQGAKIAFSHIGPDDLAKQVEADLNKITTAKEYHSNAADFDEAQKLIDDVITDFGQIDILVNNAGITRDNLLLRMSKEEWDIIMKVNLDSVFNLTKAAIKPMMKARTGSIINMASVVGVKGNAGQANYAASKAGVIGFSKSVALELGSRNIRCNAVAPGFIETEMTAKLSPEVVQGWRDAIPLKRGGQTTDVANTCLFLASDLSSYVTGQVINVDGGMLT